MVKGVIAFVLSDSILIRHHLLVSPAMPAVKFVQAQVVALYVSITVLLLMEYVLLIVVQAAFNAQIQYVVNALKIIILLVLSVPLLAQLVLPLLLVSPVLAIAI